MKYGYLLTIISLVSTSLIFPGYALAINFGAIATNITGQGTQIANLILILSVLAGIAFVAMGFFTMFKASKGRGESTWGRGWSLIFVGVALTSLGAVITSGSQTIWGTDESSANLSTLGL